MGEESTCNAGDTRNVDSIPESGKFLEEGHGNPLQYSCLENPMDRRAWQALVHGIKKSWTRLKRLACPQAKQPDSNTELL